MVTVSKHKHGYYLVIASWGRNCCMLKKCVYYILSEENKAGAPQTRYVTFFIKQRGFWYQGLSPWTSNSLTKEHPEISSPVGLLPGHVGSRSIILCQEKQHGPHKLLHMFKGFPKARSRSKMSQHILNSSSSFDHYGNAESELSTYWDWNEKGT